MQLLKESARSCYLPKLMCRCTKVGALLLTPLLVRGRSEPRAATTLSREEQGSRREAEGPRQTRQHQGRDHKEQRDEAGSPDKTLARAASAAPTRPLPGWFAQTPVECATIEPTVSNNINHVGPGLGRHLHGGMHIFVKTENTQDQMRTSRRRPSVRS